MGTEIVTSLRSAWTNFLDILSQFLPRLLSMLAILIVGWLIALLIRTLCRRLLGWIRFNALLERSGTSVLLTKAGAPLPDQLVATVLFWITWATFLLSGMQALGIAGAEELAADLVRFLPKLFVGVVILVVGFGLANFLWRVVLIAAVNARIQQARLLSALVRALVLIAAIAMAVDQIGIGEKVMHLTFAIAFGGVMLGTALAFGIGGRHVARRFLEQKLVARDSKSDVDSPSHL
jgi:hypothetical protein